MQWEETFDAIPPTTEIKTGHNYDNKNSTLAFFAAKYCAQPLPASFGQNLFFTLHQSSHPD